MQTIKQVDYTRAATKVLGEMPANTARLIRAKVDQYASDPGSLANNVKKLQGEDGIRLRVGSWRIIMDETGLVITIVRIAPRGSAYR